MSWDAVALLEPLLVFGGLVLFIHWQFRELRQRAAAREKAAPEAAEAGSDETPRHSPG